LKELFEPTGVTECAFETTRNGIYYEGEEVRNGWFAEDVWEDEEVW
jgi:hypothetical protein